MPWMSTQTGPDASLQFFKMGRIVDGFGDVDFTMVVDENCPIYVVENSPIALQEVIKTP